MGTLTGLLIAFYFLPFFLSVLRGKDSCLAIGVFNLCLGWTVVGWLVALVWACS